MSVAIIYLLKVIAIHGLFLFFYRFFLRDSTHHALNRAYLLGALFLSFVVPLIEFPLLQEREDFADSSPVIHWLTEPTQPLEQLVIVPVEDEFTFSWWLALVWGMIVITFVLVVRSMVYLYVLQKIKRHSQAIKKRWFTLYKTSHDRPFSFFRSVFIPKNLFGSEAFRQILAHECVHVRQFHSLDRLVVDFIVSLFWFNPFIYLYRNALIEIHEYQADETVIRQFNDPIGYQEMLFSQLQSPKYSGLVSHFNVEMIKKRIVMMNKPKKRTGWIYFFTLPVTLMIVFAFSSKEAMKPINEVGNEISGLIGPIDDLKEATYDFFQGDKEPSILPFKESHTFRLTSGFGMRTHPIYKVKKMHQGTDFACEIGTEILSTADGVVEKIAAKFSGYGKYIVIDHGNGFKTKYAQLSEFKVEQGEEVKKGGVIALSGNSGMSTAPHLHYEVIKDGEFVNPMDYIKNYKVTTREIPSRAEDNEEDHQIEHDTDGVKLSRKSGIMEVVEHHQEIPNELYENMSFRETHKYDTIVPNDDEQNVKVRFQGDKKPLFVIDGEIVDEVSDLDPGVIEELVVLKGKEAKKLYGKKGENGVIEIKTKMGKIKDKKKKKSKEKDKNKELS